MNRTALNISLYGIAHCLVDAACVATVFYCSKSLMKAENFAVLVVLYNIVAFGLQPILGVASDVMRVPVKAGYIGCLLSAAALFLTGVPLAAVCISGIGNALFHVGGGTVSLNLNPGKASLLGIFVAPGAFGVLIGSLAGKNDYNIRILLLVLLIAVTIMIILSKEPVINYNKSAGGSCRKFELVVILLLLSISIRSMIGLSLDFPWKSDPVLLVLLTLSVFSGKAMGGILADKLGYIKVSVAALAVSSVMISFGLDTPFLAIAGVFLFNMTMPVTLVVISDMFPGRAGFAFGLTALSLLIGAFPTFTPIRLTLYGRWVILIIIMISAAALFYGLKFAVPGEREMINETDKLEI